MGSEKGKWVGLSYGRRSITYEEEKRGFFFCSLENAYEGVVLVWVNGVVKLAGFDLG